MDDEPVRVPINGQALGNRRTNSVNLVIAQIEAGKVLATNEGIKEALDYWDTAFLRHEKTGSYQEIPF